MAADPFEQLGYGGPELDESALAAVPNPLTLVPKRTRSEIVKYRVQAGDTVSGIAEKFEIRPETIMWANAQLEDDPDLLSIGETLVILPVNGIYHTIGKGDTLESIARKHSIDVNAIMNLDANQLNPEDGLTVGQWIIVPGGKKPVIQKQVRTYSGAIPVSAARGTGNFGWPVSGVITQKYWAFHQGIDIGAQIGTRVTAADSGFVIFAGWDTTGFGKMILIDHGNGYATLYGHLDGFAVSMGDSVKKGQLIGRVGNTGRSTGAHLDFRIRQGGAWRNPFGFLK
jgi:murein DD-endopeptidase MepM/ murein hydrolase activator NlpD